MKREWEEMEGKFARLTTTDDLSQEGAPGGDPEPDMKRRAGVGGP